MDFPAVLSAQPLQSKQAGPTEKCVHALLLEQRLSHFFGFVTPASVLIQRRWLPSANRQHAPPAEMRRKELAHGVLVLVLVARCCASKAMAPCDATASSIIAPKPRKKIIICF